MPILSRRVPVAIAALLLAAAAHAGPPFVTDDPEPVEHGHWEVNYAISRTWHAGSASTALPAIDINYGIVPNVQVHAQPRYSSETDAHGRKVGLDDTEVGVKSRFMHYASSDTTFMAGIYPMLQLPTDQRRLGNGRGRLQSFLPLWVQIEHGAWSGYGGIAYRINQGPQNRNAVFTGATLLYKFAPDLQLGGELFRETAGATDSTSTSGFNLGGNV